ncbi:DUF2339 domain-containing protein [Alkalihalobacterium alkalicellulosilyticum]|uniref:DUF2339 domain-containing protein n=1 Tax=Alkalihalobacterium alkalicellulosilyticum TaxID=1912214 RepID=UPI000997B1FD|nr:DUF2339 domain-containing protein [Bacillus alkalicellulosilyticus]
MDLQEKMREIREKHKQLTSEYDAVIREYESSDVSQLVQEMKALKLEYDNLKDQLHESEKQYEKKAEENRQLKTALQEQILDEKLSILKVSQQKLTTYFKIESSKYKHKLEELEQKTKKRIENLSRKANHLVGEEKEKIHEAITQLSLSLEQKLNEQRRELEAKERDLLQGIKSEIEDVGSEPVSEEVIQKRMKQNQIEMKIGLNWVNKIGILLILFGVGAASKYTYSTWFNDYMKGSVFFLLGGLLLAGGEWAYRKNKTTFATGLLGGGVSVLYGAIFYGYFQLQILGLFMAILLSVVVTMTTILLSLRYQSRTICTLGLIGGYFPFLSFATMFGLEGTDIYVAMGYLLLLHLSVLLISLSRKWNVVHYISFGLHIPPLIYLVFESPSEAVAMAYTFLTFVMYVAITLAYPFKTKQSLQGLDVVLLGINTFISCMVLYVLFEAAGLDDFRGLLALVFALMFIGLGQLVERILAKEVSTIVLFYVTAVTFAILMIPFQFGVEWMALGWLIEGALLLLFGYRNQLKTMEIVGWGIFSVSIVVFYLFDFLFALQAYQVDSHFYVKFAAVTVAMIAITYFYLYEREKNKDGQSRNSVGPYIAFFKNMTLVNTWIYFLYTSMQLYDYIAPLSSVHFTFYKWVLAAFITIGMAYGCSKIEMIQDRFVRFFRMALYLISYVIILSMTTFNPVLEPTISQNTFYHYLALGLLIAFNVFVILSSKDLIVMYLRKNYHSIEFFPLIIGLYLLGNITTFMVVQFRLDIESLVISIIYLLMAISFILYGFKRQFVYLRRVGLALSLLSTTKLFLFDLTFLTQGSKIVAYFCFGITLLAISFIYQKVSNKIDDTKKVEDNRVTEKM